MGQIVGHIITTIWVCHRKFLSLVTSVLRMENNDMSFDLTNGWSGSACKNTYLTKRVYMY